MTFKELLEDLKEGKIRVLINGMGSGTTKGTIIEVAEDFITFQLLDVQVEKSKSEEKHIAEIKYIPISQIHDISEGQKETKEKTGLTKFQESKTAKK